MSKQREIYYENDLFSRYGGKKNVSSFYMIQAIRPIRDIHILRMQDKRSIDIKIYKKVKLYLTKNSLILIV